MRRQITPYYLKDSDITNLMPYILKDIPKVSARFWAIYDAQRSTLVHGRQEYVRREMASLTKMMTALCVVKLCKSFKLDIKTTQIKICAVASDIRGTTACLRFGDSLSVE